MKISVDLLTWGVLLILIHHITSDQVPKKIEHAHFFVPDKVSFKI